MKGRTVFLFKCRKTLVNLTKRVSDGADHKEASFERNSFGKWIAHLVNFFIPSPFPSLGVQGTKWLAVSFQWEQSRDTSFSFIWDLAFNIIRCDLGWACNMLHNRACAPTSDTNMRRVLPRYLSGSRKMAVWACNLTLTLTSNSQKTCRRMPRLLGSFWVLFLSLSFGIVTQHYHGNS